MEQTIHFSINGKMLEAPAKTTILSAAKNAGIHIPTLCFLKDCNNAAACRMCVVELKGSPNLVASCVTPVREGMEIITDSEIVQQSRKRSLDLLCKKHRMDCEYCSRYSDCEFHALIRENGLDDRIYMKHRPNSDEDHSASYLVRDYSKCILCRRCFSACSKQCIRALGIKGRGPDTKIGPSGPLPEQGCIACGQCIASCPTGALREADDTPLVWHALSDHNLHTVALVSSDVGTRIGELFRENISFDHSGKICAMLHKLGFEQVYLLEDIQQMMPDSNPEKLSIDTACPAAVQYCKEQYPELSELFRHEDTLVQRCAMKAREISSQKLGVDVKHIFVTVITPCLAEKTRTVNSGQTHGADAALTTRELGILLTRACVSRFTLQKIWCTLSDEIYDSEHLKSCKLDKKTEKTESQITVTGIPEIRKIMDSIKNNKIESKQIYIYACPGGCSNGGGQPRHRKNEGGNYVKL